MASVLPHGSLVLVTGASGFIATHTIQILLERGFRVRGTVRSAEKGDYLKNSVFKDYADKFSYVIADLQSEGAFDEAVKGVEGILHVASPLYRGTNASDPWNLIIEPAKKGTTGILKAAHELNKDVKRIVITSSFTALANDKGPSGVFTEDDWNTSATEEAIRKGKSLEPVRAYAASKTWAEQAAWEFVEKEKPTFDIVTILPPLVCGPILNPASAPPALNRSNIWLWGYLTGSKEYPGESAKLEPPIPVVDVRDIALGHVESLLRPAAGNLRISISEGNHNYQEFLDAIRASPALANGFPNATWGEPGVKNDGPQRTVDASRSVEVLGMKYRAVEDTARDAAESLLKWGREMGWEGA